MEVKIELQEATNGKFAGINLVYNNQENIESKVPLLLYNFVDAFDLTRDVSSVKFDLFLLSAIVYGVDNLVNRDIYSVDGWTRELEVKIPVNNLGVWQGNERLIEEMLNFLTGDYWSIGFYQTTINNFFIEKARRWRSKIKSFDVEKIKCTSLFSGGLDSLIGVIDELEKLDVDDEILFVSHFDFKSAGPNSDQNALFDFLITKYPGKINRVQVKLALARKNQHSTEIKTEGNYRSRSLFFIGLGVYLSPSGNLIIPENGTISINYPLTPSRVSSLSTRTTHPFVISKIQLLLSNLGINTTLINPYKFRTKGEMIEQCLNRQYLTEIQERAVSCGKRSRKQHWEIENIVDTDHCGICMPCIYRRAALHKVNMDTQLYGNSIENALTRNTFVDLPALINYLKKQISLEQMKRDILVNGSIPLNDLNDYAEMVIRSKAEVTQLFIDKGNVVLKTELGI